MSSTLLVDERHCCGRIMLRTYFNLTRARATWYRSGRVDSDCQTRGVLSYEPLIERRTFDPRVGAG